MEVATVGCAAGYVGQSQGQWPSHHAAAAADLPRRTARPGDGPTAAIQPSQLHPQRPEPQVQPREGLQRRASSLPRPKRRRDQDQHRQAVRRRLGEVYAKTVVIETPPDLASVFAEQDAANAAGRPAGCDGSGDGGGSPNNCRDPCDGAAAGGTGGSASVGGDGWGDGRVARTSGPWIDLCREAGDGAGAGIDAGAAAGGDGGSGAGKGGDGCGGTGGPMPEAPVVACTGSVPSASPEGGACSATFGRPGSPPAHQAVGPDGRGGIVRSEGVRGRNEHDSVRGGSCGGSGDSGSRDCNSRGSSRGGSGGSASLDVDSLTGPDPLPELPAPGGAEAQQHPPDVIDLTAASDSEEDAVAAAGRPGRQREPSHRLLAAQGTATPALCPQPQCPSKQPPPQQQPPQPLQPFQPHQKQQQPPQQQQQPHHQKQQQQQQPGSGAEGRRLQRLCRLKGIITLSREARQQHAAQQLLAQQFLAQQYLAKRQQQQQQPARPCELPSQQPPVRPPPLSPSHQQAEHPPRTSPVKCGSLSDRRPGDPSAEAMADGGGPREGGGPRVGCGPREGDVTALAATALRAIVASEATAAAAGTAKSRLAMFRSRGSGVVEIGVAAAAALPPARALPGPPAPPPCGPRPVTASRTPSPYTGGCRSDTTEVASAAETLLRLCTDSVRRDDRRAADGGAQAPDHGGGDGARSCERRAELPMPPPPVVGRAPADLWRGGGFLARAPLQPLPPPPPQPPPHQGPGAPQGEWAAAAAARERWRQAPSPQQRQPQWQDIYLLPPPAQPPPQPPPAPPPPGQQFAQLLLLLQQHRPQVLQLQQQAQRQREQPKKRRGRPCSAAGGRAEPHAPQDVAVPAPPLPPSLLKQHPPPPLKQQQSRQQQQQQPPKRRWGRTRKME